MDKKEIIPELFVLGAGPGDPDLLTIKGYEVLAQADIVLYDNLANKELLDIAPVSADKIYVGKQPYGKYTPQDDILDMIKHFCFTKGKVVRLKGGDPFIFGRGFEEIIFARQLGIKTHFIPGITSMQACGLENIPLTHRSISEGIWIVTGTKKDGTLSADLRLAMQSNATVVVYMGMKQLSSIADTYLREGRGDTPAAIIQHASLKHQKSASGLVKNLPAIAADNGLTYPAIIIIGNVVELKDIVNMEAYESAH